jgi:paraquat-inducible protein A
MLDTSKFPRRTAAARGLAACHVCGKVAPVENAGCGRCGAPLHLRKPCSLQRTLALTVAATFLYLPANLLPIMTVESLTGGAEPSTIVEGVITFWQTGAYPVAIIIFIASIVIPILKIFSIFGLCLAARMNRRPIAATRVYRMTEIVGRWSMVDVFVVAILVSVVQLGSLMSIRPGPAALAFASVVVLTMLAAHTFDQRLIWDVTRPGPQK